jgi:hypothetical protein
MAVLEGSQYAYWIGKQAGGQGSAATNAQMTIPLAVTGGSVSSTRSDGQERFPTYGGRFYSAVDWVDSIEGQGELTCAGHPTTAAALAKFFLGTEVAGGGTAPYTKTLTAATSSLWTTLVKKVGVLEGTGAGAPRREQYEDGRITQLVFEGSTANKMLRVTPTFLFARPGKIRETTDPTATIPSERPFVYTDGSSQFKFSTDTATAVIQTSTTSFQITVNDTLNAAPGDTITPLGYLPGESICSVAIETTANADSIGQYNRLMYGAAAPSVGDYPTSDLPSVYGSLDIKLNYGTGAGARSIQFLIPQIKWTPTGEIPTNTDGSPVTLNFTGEARGTTNLLTVVSEVDYSATF